VRWRRWAVSAKGCHILTCQGVNTHSRSHTGGQADRDTQRLHTMPTTHAKPVASRHSKSGIAHNADVAHTVHTHRHACTWHMRIPLHALSPAQPQAQPQAQPLVQRYTCTSHCSPAAALQPLLSGRCYPRRCDARSVFASVGPPRFSVAPISAARFSVARISAADEAADHQRSTAQPNR
jgi:hypothetical protein